MTKFPGCRLGACFLGLSVAILACRTSSNGTEMEVSSAKPSSVPKVETVKDTERCGVLLVIEGVVKLEIDSENSEDNFERVIDMEKSTDRDQIKELAEKLTRVCATGAFENTDPVKLSRVEAKE